MNDSMRILVTFALETEFAPWRAMHSFAAENWGSVEVLAAEISGARIGVLLTGAGPKQASLRTADAILRAPDSIDVCISSGLAGALKDSYGIAQVLVAKSVFSEAFHPELAGKILSSSDALVSFAGECSATVVDQFYSAQHAISTAEEKKHLGKLADAVEMESFEVMFQAFLRGIPSIAIRSISDLANEDLPLDMDGVFSDEGQVSIPRVIGQVAAHPAAIPGLIRLAEQSKQASQSLAAFLNRYISVLASRAASLSTSAAAGQ